VGYTILRLIEATSGNILFDNRDVLKLDPPGLRQIRSKMQIIFQDPYSSLNPRMTVAAIVGEPLDVHKMASNDREKNKKVETILTKVGLSSEHLNRHPHEFSGGQRQRIGIARALVVNPKLIVADEPISSLDVSIQAQIINLLKDLQREFGLTYLFISHNLSVVKHISDRVAVMYLGRIVEIADKKGIFEKPLHPYTRSLLSAIPVADPTVKRKRIVLQGDVPSPIHPPAGCRFHPRCPEATERCSREEPVFVECEKEHSVACHLAG
jgi:oligopeptide/dipeptide ABC transporter ATP-binding protein